jgi:hypothetical protein
MWLNIVPLFLILLRMKNKKMVFAEIEDEYEQSETYRSKKNFMVLQNLDSGARKNFTFLGLNLCCLI